MKIEVVTPEPGADLSERNIDLAIRPDPAPSPDLVSARLIPTRHRAVASAAYLRGTSRPRGLNDLALHNCLANAASGKPEEWLFRKPSGEIVTHAPEGHFRFSSRVTLKQALVAGLGLGMLPNWMVRRELASGVLVDVFPDHDCALGSFDRSVWLVSPNRGYLPAKTRAMIDFLQDTVCPHHADAPRPKHHAQSA